MRFHRTNLGNTSLGRRLEGLLATTNLFFGTKQPPDIEHCSGKYISLLLNEGQYTTYYIIPGRYQHSTS